MWSEAKTKKTNLGDIPVLRKESGDTEERAVFPLKYQSEITLEKHCGFLT